MAETNYKKLLGLMGGTALLAVALTLAGCASAPEKKAGEGAESGGKQEAAASGGDQGAQKKSKEEGSQKSAGGAGQSGGGEKSAKAAPAPKPAKKKEEPPKPDISGSDVTAIENKMKVFPRVLWHSHTNTYRFYVGTVLFAEYNPFDDKFQIMTDNADRKNLVCKYSPDKGWQVEGKSKGETCDSLLKKMDDFLANPFS